MPVDSSVSPLSVTLREVLPADLDLLFQWQLDPEANWMAAFIAPDPADRSAFDAHWKRILADPAVVKRTILADGIPVGNIEAFDLFGKLSVGYWIGREYWGRGIATRALRAFLEIVNVRPLYARVVEDNLGSQRVLQKCGFKVVLQDFGFASARQMGVTELVLRLDSIDDSQAAF